jgi:hypothetical protein
LPLLAHLGTHGISGALDPWAIHYGGSNWHLPSRSTTRRRATSCGAVRNFSRPRIAALDPVTGAVDSCGSGQFTLVAGQSQMFITRFTF